MKPLSTSNYSLILKTIKSLLCTLIVIVLLSSLYSCKSETNAPEDYDTIQTNWNQFIENWNNLDAEGCVNIYTDDALVIAPEMPISEGKESIADFYNFLFTTNRSAVYTHTTESLDIDGDLAIEHGNFSVEWVSNAGEPWTYHARVMVHWIKNETGEWKIKKLLFNTPPAPESE